MKIHTQHYASPCGELLLGDFDGRLCLCDWLTARHRHAIDNRLCRLLGAEYEQMSTTLLCSAARQLDEYFSRQRTSFDLPLLLAGTPFQRRVWQQLQHVAYGDTVSYADVAVAIGLPRAVRAVANAIGANALSVVVPCHRVIGSNGNITGYAGGLDAKQWLLRLESNHVKP